MQFYNIFKFLFEPTEIVGNHLKYLYYFLIVMVLQIMVLPIKIMFLFISLRF